MHISSQWLGCPDIGEGPAVTRAVTYRTGDHLFLALFADLYHAAPPLPCILTRTVSIDGVTPPAVPITSEALCQEMVAVSKGRPCEMPAQLHDVPATPTVLSRPHTL
jgi:hypothetical protein